MAKYDVKYSCGHGTHVVQLFGKTIERESKIEWMERSVECPNCYREKHKDDAPIAYGSLSIFTGGDFYMVFVGNTFPIKDTLKSNGYYFRSDIVKRGDILGSSRPLKGWVKKLATSEEIKNGKLNYDLITREVNWIFNTFGVVADLPEDSEMAIFFGVNKNE